MQKILVVDDSVQNLTIYDRILRQLPSVEITTFTSSAVAQSWAAEHDPDLIIVDYQMPAPNGIEFIEHVRRRDTDTPILMITASAERTVRHEALEAGGDDFLQKPADPVEFLARARNLLKLRDRGRKLADRTVSLEEKVRLATLDLVNRERETIVRLSRAVEYRDNETGNHIIRMGYYCQLLARAVGSSAETQELYLIAAPMHDIGKVAVPDRILLKEGKLTPDEWETMKTHARAGYDILKGSDSPLIELAAEIAFAHHERYDGTGYPRGLAGDAIPIAGRICAIADVFDALMSARPYKPAWELPRVIETLKESRGSHFDPHLVDAFLECMPEVLQVRSEIHDAKAA